MIQSGNMISHKLEGNKLQLLCKDSYFELTPYGEDILHVGYYPLSSMNADGKESIQWGLEGKPDENVKILLEEGDDLIYNLPEMNVVIDKKRGGLRFEDKEGKLLTELVKTELAEAIVSGEETYHLLTVFSSEEDERFYGLGQHQDGALNLGGKEQILWHDYSHKGGEIVAIPFLISDKKYGIIYDNASRIKVSPGLNKRTTWRAEVGECISFFFLAANQTDDLYRAYRKLYGETPMPPRAGLGFIQCKQRYASQEELTAVARTYQEKGYPCDIFVVDWFHWKTLGDLSVDESYWPDSKAMNEEFDRMGYDVMISCWPRFMKESDNYDYLEANGWFMHDKDGNTIYGTPDDQRGALIDTTDPKCGEWYFHTIKKNYADLGYKYWWLDENEPDISPRDHYLNAGTGARVHNVYPLTHTKCVFEGHKKELEHRCLILSRASFLGAQRYGTTFWSSDIYPEWDVLKRQIPTALNFCASGMVYWSSDIGGWQALPDESSYEDFSSLLIATSSEGKGKITSKNFAELYVRWFQFGVFCPTFRTHGTRKENEVWSYGEEAEKILAKYLKLRYELMPYIYSLAYQAHKEGTPFMRALWMDYEDQNCREINDEFLFGPAFLVAPIVEQGQTQREVYLPAGTDWIDYHTNKKHKGGQTIKAPAPLDTIPLYVKAGSIIPTGEEVLNLRQQQNQIKINIYPGQDCNFELYSDDGRTYAYEHGDYQTTKLTWNEAKQQLTIEEQQTTDTKKTTMDATKNHKMTYKTVIKEIT